MQNAHKHSQGKFLGTYICSSILSLRSSLLQIERREFAHYSSLLRLTDKTPNIHPRWVLFRFLGYSPAIAFGDHLGNNIRMSMSRFASPTQRRSRVSFKKTTVSLEKDRISFKKDKVFSQKDESQNIWLKKIPALGSEPGMIFMVAGAGLEPATFGL